MNVLLIKDEAGDARANELVRCRRLGRQGFKSRFDCPTIGSQTGADCASSGDYACRRRIAKPAAAAVAAVSGHLSCSAGEPPRLYLDSGGETESKA